jgi:MipA family protein
VWRSKHAVPTRLISAALAACALAPALTRSQTLDEQQLEAQELAGKPAPGEWSVTLGAALASVPRYPGAEDSRLQLRPLFMIQHDDVFLSPLGLGWSVIDRDGWRVGPVLGYEGGRRESVDPRLTGLGDIPSSLTGGAFAAYRFGSLEMLLTGRQALTSSGSGFSGLATLEEHAQLIPRRLVLSFGPQVEFGNSEHEQTWFGVTPQQSAASGLPVYTAAGGVQAVGLRASLTYRTRDHWLLRAFGVVKQLTGDAADSPIVERRTQGLLGAGVAYEF